LVAAGRVADAEFVVVDLLRAQDAAPGTVNDGSG
jgi:hypothetical protein